MTLNSWTQQQIFAQLDSGFHWSGPAVLYRFPTNITNVYAPNGESNGFSPLNSAQSDTARLAFALWGDLVEKPISEVSQWAQIDVANTTTGIEFAHAYYPTKSSVWLNSNESDLTNPIVGNYSFFVYLHEFGHTLGLEHMGDYNGTQIMEPSCWEDSSMYSVMSYFGPSNNSGGDGQVAWGQWSNTNNEKISAQTPMLNDIMSIQTIYGANITTRIDNTVYGFNSNITGSLARIFDFTQNATPILCIYDAGGIDTLDLSGWSTNSRIDMNAGTFSDCNGMTSNLSIAYHSTLENLTTGDGRDTLIGNAVANLLLAGAGDDLLQGNAGDDVIDGGSGLDIAAFNYNLQNYRISYNDQSIRVEDQTTNRDGIDSLSNIEQLRFSDQTVNIHYAPKILGESTRLVNENYLNFQISAQNGNAVLIDLTSNADGISIYSDIERLQFADAVVGMDIGQGEHTGQVYRLYLTVLDRNPDADPVGCGFWIDKLDRGILDVEKMVGYFLDSQEFVSRFGEASNTSESFVNLMYLNLLGRDGHPDTGFSFWRNVLDNHLASREEVVAGFMESPENVSNAAVLIGDYGTFKNWIDF